MDTGSLPRVTVTQVVAMAAQRHQFQFQFGASVEQAWPFLADTARYNQATGLPSYRVEDVLQADGSVKHIGRMNIGQKKPFQLKLVWEEPPPEFIRHQEYSYQRIFLSGWLQHLKTNVAFQALGPDRCRVDFSLELTPKPGRGGLLKLLNMGERAGKDFSRIAGEVAEYLKGNRAQAFEFAVPPLNTDRQFRLDKLAATLADSNQSHGLTEKLCRYLTEAPDLEVRRFRPLALAKAWNVPPRHVVECCLSAVQMGLLESRWDILCPRCRGAKVSLDALDRGVPKAHCTSCAVDFSVDFERNVELTFRPAPAIREVADGEFCMLGPMSQPHVFAQKRVEPQQKVFCHLELADGRYRVRTVEPGPELEFDHRAGLGHHITLDSAVIRIKSDHLAAPFIFENVGKHARHILIEDLSWRGDALTFGQVTTLQAFRDLFPDFALKPGDEPPVSHLTLMFTDLAGSTALYERIGDAAAYALVRRHFLFLTEIVRAFNGALVKTIGDAVMAAFADPGDGFLCAQAILALMPGFNQVMSKSGIHDDVAIKIGLHHGRLVAVMLNEHLDYFGQTVNLAARIQAEAAPGELVMSAPFAEDILVSHLLAGAGTKESRILRGIEQPTALLRLSPPFDWDEKFQLAILSQLLSDLGMDLDMGEPSTLRQQLADHDRSLRQNSMAIMAWMELWG